MKKLLMIVPIMLIMACSNTPEKTPERIEIEEKAFSALRESYDEIEKIHWYQNSYFGYTPNVTSVSLYFGVNDEFPLATMRIYLSHASKGVFGLNEVIFFYDGETLKMPIGLGERNFENQGGDSWEWADLLVKHKDVKFFEQMSQGKDVKIRFKGHSTYYDYTVPELEKEALNQVVLGYSKFYKHL